jgi:hypothetical protein
MNLSNYMMTRELARDCRTVHCNGLRHLSEAHAFAFSREFATSSSTSSDAAATNPDEDTAARPTICGAVPDRGPNGTPCLNYCL